MVKNLYEVAGKEKSDRNTSTKHYVFASNIDQAIDYVRKMSIFISDIKLLNSSVLTDMQGIVLCRFEDSKGKKSFGVLNKVTSFGMPMFKKVPDEKTFLSMLEVMQEAPDETLTIYDAIPLSPAEQVGLIYFGIATKDWEISKNGLNMIFKSRDMCELARTVLEKPDIEYFNKDKVWKKK